MKYIPSPALLTLRWATTIGLPASLLGALLVWIPVAFLFRLPSSWMVTLLVGPVIGALIGASRQVYRAFRNLLNPEYVQTSTVDVEENIHLPTAYGQAFERAVESLRTLPDAWLLSQDKARGKIEVAVGPTWRSLGVRITIEMGSDSLDSTEARLTVRAPLPTTRVDFGTNRTTLERISGLMLAKA